TPSALQVYGRSVCSVGGLSNCFGERRVRVKRAYQFLDCRLESQRSRSLRDELGRARTDHMDAEQLVVFPIRDDLHEPFGLARHLRASEDAERERADPDVVAARLRF